MARDLISTMYDAIIRGMMGGYTNDGQISSTRLMTSYALPPQSSFSCNPTSFRSRVSKAKTSRRTYASTYGLVPKITVFKDDHNALLGTVSSTVSRIVEGTGNRIVFNGATAVMHGTDAPSEFIDLLIVKENGEIGCLNGETLEERWTSPASALERENDQLEGSRIIEYAELCSANTVAQGIFKEDPSVLAIYPQDILENGYNPDVLVLISRRKVKGLPLSRYIHIVAFPNVTSAHTNGSKHSVHVLLSAQFPTDAHGSRKPVHFALHALGGILHQLQGDLLTTFALNPLGLKPQSTMSVRNSSSFLRLSSTSIMIASQATLSIYNPKYQSILSTINLDTQKYGESLKRKRGADSEVGPGVPGDSYLASYFSKLSTAVAIIGNDLIAVQIEGNKDRRGESGAAGLLIDSLGCAIPGHKRGREGKPNVQNLESETLSGYLSGTLNSAKVPSSKDLSKLETAFSAGDTKEFDNIITQRALKLTPSPTANASPELRRGAATEVDRRWVIYALGKIFQLNDSDDSETHRLSVVFHAPATFLWLVKGGHVTIANIRSALRSESNLFDSQISTSELVSAVYDFNPDMDLLLALVRYNYMDAIGLVDIIKILIDSFELLGEREDAQPRLLTNGEDHQPRDEYTDAELEELEAQAEADLNLAEYQLESGSGVRGQALSLALSKLYTCPTSSIIQALQTRLSSREIVCLVYLLRFELQKGGWTAKYLDDNSVEGADEGSEVPDNAIILISTLLGNCIDAIGAGGWLTGDAMLVRGNGSSDAEDLITALKLEISAALESIEEGTYLKGITSEMVRYGNAVQKVLEQAPSELFANQKRMPVKLQLIDPEQSLLPVGLKAEQQVSRQRVGAGGEVHARSARDIGHLKSQRVGKYTFERVTI
jgi:hypothetical protein